MRALPNPHHLNHVFGPGLSQAQARELAARGDRSVGDEEIRWAIDHPPTAVREVVRRFPPASSAGLSRLGALLSQLDAALRSVPRAV
jgi:hypothetical protein